MNIAATTWQQYNLDHNTEHDRIKGVAGCHSNVERIAMGQGGEKVFTNGQFFQNPSDRGRSDESLMHEVVVGRDLCQHASLCRCRAGG